MRADALPRRLRRGISLIELMIGLAIGLMVSLAALSSLRVFSASQRQGSVAGGGVLNAGAALGVLKNDVAAAGMGFFDGRSPLCDRLNLSVGPSAVIDGTAFAPLAISRVLTQDQLDIFYATDVAAGVPLALLATSDTTRTDTLSTLPTAVGQAVLLAPTATGLCTVRSATAITPATEVSAQIISYGNAGMHNQAAFTTAGVYPGGARLSQLGTLRWHRYRVVDNNLVLEQPLLGRTAVLARGVVALRVQYGTADTGSSTLTGWYGPTDAGWGSLTAASIGQLRAVRVGLVGRHAQKDKPDPASGQCTASASKPVLFGTTIEPDVSDWACWRFHTATLVVPLRNVVWGQRP
jgi:type IV pilus assembly protein PilW